MKLITNFKQFIDVLFPNEGIAPEVRSAYMLGLYDGIEINVPAKKVTFFIDQRKNPEDLIGYLLSTLYKKGYQVDYLGKYVQFDYAEPRGYAYVHWITMMRE